MERKSFAFELEEKGLDPEERTFKGFAAVMGNVDDYKDIIVNGAFKKTIKEMRKPDGSSRIKVFWIHNFEAPIGRILDIKEVPKGKLPKEVLRRAPNATGGLWVHGYISPTPDGDAALILMRDAVLDELSIGFRTVKSEWDEDGENRFLKEIMLFDVSPVPLAANVAAILTDVKKHGPRLRELAEQVGGEVGLETPEAIELFAEALANELTRKEDKEWIDGKEAKIEETDDFIHIPVRKAADFVADSFRTITISADKGITAVIGKLKTDPDGSTKVQKYLFAKEKGWTIASAKEWVAEHAKSKELDEAREQLVIVQAIAQKVLDEYNDTGVISHETCEEFRATVTELLADWEEAEGNTEEPTGGYFAIGVDEETRQKVVDAMVQHAEIQAALIEEL